MSELFEPEKIKPYLEELEKLGILLDLSDIMDICFENSEEIGFVIDGCISIKKEKIKGDK